MASLTSLELTPISVACDIGAAFGAAVFVAPAIAMVDQSIVENASGRKTLLTSLMDSARSLLTQPHVFFTKPSFLLLWGVYGGTYIAVNSVTSVCDARNATTSQKHQAKFAVVSSVNLFLNISKDRIFAQLFGSGAPRPVPITTIGCFAARDCMTVFSTFNLAPMLGDALAPGLGPMARTGTALFCPLVMQWFSAPIHLCGLDMYNRSGVPLAERTKFIKREYVKTALARCGRIGPAFSLCPLINNPLRDSLRLRFLASIPITH